MARHSEDERREGIDPVRRDGSIADATEFASLL
jgi:hypothetical protein